MVKNVWSFIYIKTYLLVAFYHVIFYKGHNLHKIQPICVDFMLLQMDYLSIHIIYYDVNVLYCPSVLLY